MIFHITSRTSWDNAQKRGDYRAESLTTEGFIHCSTLAQVLQVANNFYKGQNGLVLLEIEPTLSLDFEMGATFRRGATPGRPRRRSVPARVWSHQFGCGYEDRCL